MFTPSDVGDRDLSLRYCRDRALSSTSLASSNNCDDDPPDVPSASARPKLTRKRFSEMQVARMETLYASTTHPSRVKREELARDIDMEAKQVTVWFQNRRQADRKIERTESYEAPPYTPDASRVQQTDNPQRHVTLLPLHAYMGATASTSALSLDAIATREEKRVRHIRRPHADEGDEVAVARPGTLEWACAQERVAHRLGERPPPFPRPSHDTNSTVPQPHNSLPSKSGRKRPAEQQTHRRDIDRNILPMSLADSQEQDGAGDTDAGEETEEEAHEAITPAGSLLAEAFKAAGAHRGKGTVTVEPARAEEDDELMNAALVLAGLGRRG
ncbi:homeobox-domain-containing protein [Peniophora sp. CONT]|nr:homeobox-domain-containing protein [Peniophora sp. CONT]